jgi:hypothetical protein
METLETLAKRNAARMAAQIAPVDWTALDRAGARLAEAKAKLEVVADHCRRHQAALGRFEATMDKPWAKFWLSRWFN